MSSENEFDVIVIGAGIAGASVAYRLSPHVRVLVLERESQPGYHSTGRSAAMFMETYGTPQIQALTRAGRGFFEQAQSSGFTEQPVLHPRGCIYVARPDQKEELDNMLAEALALSPNVEFIDPDSIVEMAPCMKKEQLYGGMLERHAEDIDVDVLHQGYLKGMRKNGAELKNNAEVVQCQRLEDKWQVKLASGESFQCKTLVNAAGAWADHIARASNVAPVGLQPCRRTAFTFDAPEGLDLTTLPMVVDVSEQYYFKPDAGQVLGSPANADPVEAQDVVAEELDVATGIYYIEEATTFKIRRPNHVWAGLRSFVKDGDLVVGFDQTAEGFFWLAGQGGYGIQSSAGVSELACALILNQPLSDTLLKEKVDPALISPNRFR
ncbi:FAD-binding oxidoreductase [Advenella alkanexedens]|jgi:D-arginine dehydrogenase|uniref:FAD-binding oxidoreductase n=1 Tax=Advenella alkanexedens TaxID=1481665 RepID=A0ABS6NMZ8_9BURK|nr:MULTISPECIES: FAD-dependent oxidoreductase [Advenella]MBV4397000.1 FAD-binding oxidoreductase [Advenella alkanexedens]MDD3756692.1 FAD-dependent oxidoreductase [Advenella sp.]NLN68147.1 FAD-binding oxidoreductase [Alcaligenaceae bacterium]